MKALKTFRDAEDGAVTVDWVVLTAATVGLGIVAMAAIGPAVGVQGSSIATAMGSVGDLFAEEGGSAGRAAGDWNRHYMNDGQVAENAQWMSGFSDEQLLSHIDNMAQFGEMPAGSGYPQDYYHDEYNIAVDEAIGRGLM
ncbi:hypothetical protein [Frigidibacter oleivorans]|uniref:hypothetical protein n=1 Tax=Frigidibacter oleivorans TaxID=2487129 RepID=UPI002E25DBAE